MDYRFKLQIETEDGEVLMEGSTYLMPETISQYGECESVEMEVGKALRFFKKENEKRNEEVAEIMQPVNEMLEKLTIRK